MTTLGVPSQGPAPHPAAGAAFAGERGTASQQDAQESSVFVALLAGLDEGGALTHKGAAPPNADSQAAASSAAQLTQPTAPVAAWRSIAAAHNMGSAVLAAIDKRINGTSAPDAAAGETAKAKGGETADASTPSTVTWASLLMGASGAPPIARVGMNPAAEKNAAPADAAPASVAPTVALNAGAAPVDVHVLRSITYLGLDPTARDKGAAAAPANASIRSGQDPSNAAHQAFENAAPIPSAKLNSDSSAMSGGEQSRRNMHGADSPAPAKSTASTNSESTPVDPVAATANAAADASLNGAAGIPVGQLADFIAKAASSMDPRASEGSAAPSAVSGASPAGSGPVKELDVQLNPASLGVLTIHMRLSNGTLNVTVKAANPDTLKLIDNERAAISDKLKSLDFTVAAVSVKALDTVASVSAGADASQTGTSSHGEAQQGQSGQAADGSKSSGGRSYQRDGGQQTASQGRPNGLDEVQRVSDLGYRFV